MSKLVPYSMAAALIVVALLLIRFGEDEAVVGLREMEPASEHHLPGSRASAEAPPIRVEQEGDSRLERAAPDLAPVASEPGPPGSRLVLCEVRGSGSEVPLTATLSMGADSWVCAEDGTALVPHVPGGVLAVRHPGYRELRVEMPEARTSPLPIRLTPEGSCVVEVVDELGVLLPGVEVRQIAARPSGGAALSAERWSRIVARTDADGRARVPASGSAWVFALLDGRASSPVALIGGEDRPVVIHLPDRRATRLGLRGADGVPVEAMDVRVREATSLGLPAILLSSDSSGLLSGTLPLGDYVLDVPWGSAVLEVDAEMQTSSVARRVLGLTGSAVHRTVAPDDRTRWIALEPMRDLVVEARDPAGALVRPLEFWEEVRRESTDGAATWRRIQAPGSVFVPGARFSLSVLGRADQLGAPGYRVVVASPGYRSAVLDSRVASNAGGVTPLTLEPHREERILRVLDTTGAPYRGPIRVREAGRAWTLYDGLPDPRDGRLGPFAFAGPGDLEVMRRSGPLFQIVEHLPVAAFDRDPEPLVVVGGGASLRIVAAAAEASRIRVVGRDRRVWAGEPHGEDLLVDGLPPGRYAVADRSALPSLLRLVGDLSLNLTPRTPEEVLPIELREGEERRVDPPRAPAEWRASGRVILPPGLDGRLFLYPLEAGGSLPRRAEGSDLRLPLAPSGHYRSEPLPFVPTSLVLARVDDVGWILPLAVFAPDETPRPRGARVVLHHPGLTGALCQGTVDWGGAPRFAYRLASGVERVDLGWFPEGGLEVLVVDPADRYARLRADVPAEGGITIELPADDEARSSWPRAPEDAGF